MSDVVRTAQRYFDAWNRRDAAGVVASFAEGGTYSDPVAHGLSGDAIGAYARGLWESFPDLAFEVAGQMLVGDGQLAAQWRMTGTNTGPFKGLPPTGRSVTLAGADFITVEDERIRSVRGYFDAGELPRQLGLQVLVQPHQVGPYQFGTAVAVQSGKRTKPAAFSITVLHARTDAEVDRVRNQSRQIAAEMLAMPEFIGWTGMVVGKRMITVSAWDDAEGPRRLMREGTHVQAMRTFFSPEVAAGAYTSVWRPERFNATWVRCLKCSRMSDYDRAGGRCACGEALAEPPPYW